MMLANLVIAGGVTITSLALLELLLTDSQKQQLERLLVRSWSWLDDLRDWSLSDWLKTARNKRRFMAATIAVFLALILGIKVAVPDVPWPKLFLFLLAAALVAAPWTFLVMTRLPLYDVTSRLYIAAFAAVALFFVIPAVDTTFLVRLGAGHWLRWPIHALTIVLWVTTLLVAIASSPFVIAIFASMILGVVEFVVRRIAEYPKGPIIGISILVASIVGLVKVLS
jgi:hypothetical protein